VLLLTVCVCTWLLIGAVTGIYWILDDPGSEGIRVRDIPGIAVMAVVGFIAFVVVVMELVERNADVLIYKKRR
jgi:polyferredoxin